MTDRVPGMRSPLVLYCLFLVIGAFYATPASGQDPCYSIIARRDKAQNTFKIDPIVDALPGWREVIRRSVNNWNVRGTNFVLREAVESGNRIVDGRAYANFFRGGELMVTRNTLDATYDVFIEERSVIFINTAIQWFLGVATNNLPPGSYDAESALTHEFGHFLGLDDLDAVICADPVMREDISSREVRRSLSASDMKGLLLLYGAPCRPNSPSYVQPMPVSKNNTPGDAIVRGPFQLLSFEIMGAAALLRQENGPANNGVSVRTPLDIPSGWVITTDDTSTGMYSVTYAGCRN